MQDKLSQNWQVLLSQFSYKVLHKTNVTTCTELTLKVLILSVPSMDSVIEKDLTLYYKFCEVNEIQRMFIKNSVMLIQQNFFTNSVMKMKVNLI